MAQAEPDFFTDPAIGADPKAYFDRLRSRCPVIKEDYHGSLMVTGYDEVMAVLNRRDDVFSAAVSTLGPIPPLPFEPQGDDIREQLDAHRDELPWSAHLPTFDGKKHADHRALLTSVLSYKRLKENEDYLGKLAERVIDDFIHRGECDVAHDYAHTIATYAISDLMGVPEADRSLLTELLGTTPSQVEGEPAHRIGADPLIFLQDLFDGYIRQRLESPGSDLMSELAQSRFKDGSTSDLSVLSRLARLLFAAAQDTTSKLITMSLMIIGDKPKVQAALRNAPERIADFLEEVLRFDPPVKAIYRLAQRSTSVGGVEVPAGTIVTACLTAANNDPRHFQEPENFDMDRSKVRDHLAFSRGPHMCPGSTLARIEGRVALERILARTANIRISEAHHGAPEQRRFRFEPTYSFRGLSELHIEFTPA